MNDSAMSMPCETMAMQKLRVNRDKCCDKYVQELMNIVEKLSPIDIISSPVKTKEESKILARGFFRQFQIEIVINKVSFNKDYLIEFWIDDDLAETHFVDAVTSEKILKQLEALKKEHPRLSHLGRSEIMNNLWSNND